VEEVDVLCSLPAAVVVVVEAADDGDDAGAAVDELSIPLDVEGAVDCAEMSLLIPELVEEDPEGAIRGTTSGVVPLVLLEDAVESVADAEPDGDV